MASALTTGGAASPATVGSSRTSVVTASLRLLLELDHFAPSGHLEAQFVGDVFDQAARSDDVDQAEPAKHEEVDRPGARPRAGCWDHVQEQGTVSAAMTPNGVFTPIA